MMINKENVKKTIDDLEKLKDKVLKRHAENTDFCLRFETVINSLIGSLQFNAGLDAINSNANTAFTTEPITKFMGKDVNVTTGAIVLPELEVDEVEMFKQKLNLIIENFNNRDTTDILDALTELELRGVGKLVNLEGYATLPIDGQFVEAIKTQISLNNNEDTAKKETMQQLNPEKTLLEKFTDALSGLEPELRLHLEAIMKFYFEFPLTDQFQNASPELKAYIGDASPMETFKKSFPELAEEMSTTPASEEFLKHFTENVAYPNEFTTEIDALRNPAPPAVEDKKGNKPEDTAKKEKK